MPASPLPLPEYAPVLAEVQGKGAVFPVRRIYCVGQNYAEHAREMGSDPDRPSPFFFSKPADAVVPSGRVLPFPGRTENLHHEVELVVALGGGGHDLAPEDAEALVFGAAVGFDMTRRDLQAEAKAKGRPWDMAKGFDASAPLGPIVPGLPPRNAAIHCELDGVVRQQGDIAQMIWSVPEILAHLSRYVTLAPGDLVFTGTPAGVGPVRAGQHLRGEVAGLPPVEVRYDA
ncbi:fumarylacetoacetate hydrolase family protein [Novosphingobium mangrovi (ex Hu et al. 2023)]|uniref:Fumarylacetoacetate hydrolase family protein n=1 Tax=Novosphingobium mangrovi (ex Hu et al. 2023) TaxID=2930094 RepID=A0ABT0AIB5_9SPHN|nr:fumarylacetoacetate hydrolase family protein [Novosphingobium mangrovi (ex Hu et al. 2023)]MCJ1962903.1 fumarylacetoacetate hydrolase family protein [Novosphingobium mangrovi (ex Hu et al. 2023)]